MASSSHDVIKMAIKKDKSCCQ